MERKGNEAWRAALGPPQLIVLIGAVMTLFLQTMQALPDFWIVAFAFLVVFGMAGIGFGASRRGHNDGFSKISSRLIRRRDTPPSDPGITKKKPVPATKGSPEAVQADDSYWLHDSSTGLGENAYTALGETRRNIYSLGSQRKALE